MRDRAVKWILTLVGLVVVVAIGVAVVASIVADAEGLGGAGGWWMLLLFLVVPVLVGLSVWRNR
jgi:hypothetical protein